MKKILITLIVLLLAPAMAHATSFRHFINKQNCDQILDKGYYQICYDYKMKGARYVAYDLDGSKVDAVNIKKRPRFYPDMAIPRQYRTFSKDYTHNEFSGDRGHLAPDANFDFSKKSLHSVYSMANIIPQYKKINRGRKQWAGAERYERYVAKKLGFVSVVNGVIYGKNPQRLRRSGIAYPVGYWKMIYNEQKGFKRCFYYKNDSHADWKNDSLRKHEFDCRKAASGRL